MCNMLSSHVSNRNGAESPAYPTVAAIAATIVIIVFISFILYLRSFSFKSLHRSATVATERDPPTAPPGGTRSVASEWGGTRSVTSAHAPPWVATERDPPDMRTHRIICRATQEHSILLETAMNPGYPPTPFARDWHAHTPTWQHSSRRSAAVCPSNPSAKAARRADTENDSTPYASNTPSRHGNRVADSQSARRKSGYDPA